jgi:hypothetical protein
MKTMADSLGDLGWPVEDRILVLNVLRGLSDRYCNTPGVTSVLSRVVKAGENHLNEFLDFFLDFKTRLK